MPSAPSPRPSTPRPIRPAAGAAALVFALACLAALAPAIAAPSAPLKVLRYSLPVAETGFDPAQVADTYSSQVIDNIFESPLRYDLLARPMRLRTATAAELPQMSADFRELTLKITPGLYFADDPAFHGVPRELTATDYAYTLRRHYDPRVHSVGYAELQADDILGLQALRDRAVMIATTVALSVSFLVYVILGQYAFGFQLGWFPVQGWSDSTWTNLVTYAPLPVLLAVTVGLSPQTRLYRSFFLDELGHDYVRTARAKGLTEPAVMLRHVLRNAMIPILTNIGLGLPGIVVGSFLIEVYFGIPGIGREVWRAVGSADYPVIEAVTIYVAMLTMLANLATDLLYRAVDPRVVLR